MRWMSRLLGMMFGVSGVRQFSWFSICAPSSAVLVCALAHLADMDYREAVST